ncbi:Pumilio-like 12 [Quillaja saponaria]|uniref:Pumilio-like 12 n=1 Tax=Quillaja saponaria TaxID=32244 RepID=A0AAD7LCZ9_QUISA|nr:Pumilio-like 12 [Quillaja saponaria]
MEEQKTEHEFDEFEKLLDEIPNATSGKPRFIESGPRRLFLDRSISPICVDSCKGPLDEGKLTVNKIQKSTIERVQAEEPSMPDDQLLVTAFGDLSLNDERTRNCRSLQNHAILLDVRNSNSLKKPNFNIDTRLMVVPSFHSPVSVPYDHNRFDVEKTGMESSNSVKFGAEEHNKQPTGYWHPTETSLPVAHTVNGFQVMSNVPVPGGQYSAMKGQQQFLLDSASPFRFLHSHRIDQPQFCRRNMEEEQYHRIHQQYLFLQQLRVQQPEAHYLLQANGKMPTIPMYCNQRPPYFGVSVQHQLEKSYQQPLLNKHVVLRDSDQSYSAFSSTDYHSIQVLDKVEERSSPEKLLTRSKGVDTFNGVKFASVGRNELQTPVCPNGKVLSNGHFWRSLSTPNAELDSFQSSALSPYNKELKNISLKPLPQKFTSVDEVTGRIYLMAKDQHGCRFLQRQIAEGTPRDVEKIFLEIINYTVELMTDPFGNYLVQKLLEVCDEEKRMWILCSITSNSGELVRISCDMHGTRAVQKVIETLKTPEQFSMVVSSLKPGIVTLMKNMNGNHVAQRCLLYFSPELNEFLFEAATNNCVELAMDRYGCCVIQKCLCRSDSEQGHRLVCEITSNALFLSQDPFGNYVVQYVLELQLPWATIEIFDQLEGNYPSLSIQKCSSNVVEKCLRYADEEHRTRIVKEFIDDPRLDQIMQDPYGNYVIQAAVDQSKGTLVGALMNAIRPHIPVLRTSPYGKKVLYSISAKK